MTTKTLSFKAPPSLAVAIDATSPNPGQPGVRVWSTIALKTLEWDGTKWADPTTGGGSAGFSQKRPHLWS